jgi:hypothetical protein
VRLLSPLAASEVLAAGAAALSSSSTLPLFEKRGGVLIALVRRGRVAPWP